MTDPTRIRRVLGIETSCDDTAAAVYDRDAGLLAHRRHSQTALHQAYGGVVPELASRDHIRRLAPLARLVLGEAGLSAGDIDAVAYTRGPGLIGALLVGASFGRSLAYALGVPALGVHHMEGHLLSPLLESEGPAFPFLALLVSGGHTLLADVQGLGAYRVLGESVDDAVGEAFDKTAKLLGLGYPGGPAIERAAAGGDAGRHRFPRPMIHHPGFDFSFSGLKTACSVAAREQLADDTAAVADIAASFQAAAVETLVARCRQALAATGHRRLVVAGGVSANRMLRDNLDRMTGELGARAYYPRFELCTDNAAMIAFAGYARLVGGESQPLSIDARPRWPIAELRSRT